MFFPLLIGNSSCYFSCTCQGKKEKSLQGCEQTWQNSVGELKDFHSSKWFKMTENGNIHATLTVGTIPCSVYSNNL